MIIAHSDKLSDIKVFFFENVKFLTLTAYIAFDLQSSYINQKILGQGHFRPKGYSWNKHSRSPLCTSTYYTPRLYAFDIFPI